jgi:hypothetical protein
MPSGDKGGDESGWYWSRVRAGDCAMCVGRRARLRRATLGEVRFADVWLPGDQHPLPGATRADDAGETLELAERPTASEPRHYDSFCNFAATTTGLVTVSKTGDNDRAASRISCRVSSSASEATR